MTDRRGPLRRRAGWHAAALGVLLFVPGFLAFGVPFWRLPGRNRELVLGLACVYLFAAVVSLLSARSGGRPRLAAVVSAASAGLAALFLGFLLLPDPTYSRSILLLGLVLGAGGLLLPCLPARAWKYSVVSALAAVALATGAYGIDVALGGTISDALGVRSVARGILGESEESGPRTRTEVVRTSRHMLQATFYSGQLPERQRPLVSGGALAPDPTGDGYLLARARGGVYRFRWDDSGGLDIRPLGVRVPVNNAEFEADVGEDVPRQWFRVADILAGKDGDGVRLLASHHFWKRDDRCFVVRVSGIRLSGEGAGEPDRASGWETVYESAPCLPIKSGSRGVPFAGLQIGGNMAWVDPDTLLLTVGDHQFDGWYGQPNLVRDSTADYGKTLAVHLPTGRKEIFTLGHRNPQGLAVDAGGRAWSTEHGPEGGDELNLLVRGGDYGWPYETYGTEYGSVSWPYGDSAGVRLDGSRRPVFAWVPSIGISEVVSIADTAFRAWASDLLVAALRGQEIWRLRLDGERVAYTEPIEIGERIRDVIAPGDGSIVLWTDDETIVRIQPARSLDRGATLFALRCGGCHEIGPQTEHGIGPNLRGVVGRPVASAPGFDYSGALADLEGRWTEERLDGYLSDPDAFAPGTTMAFEGVADAAARASIVRYLRSLE